MAEASTPRDIARREEFLPPSLEGRPNATIFILDVPPPCERDRIGTRLFELGVVAPTREAIRATIIDELYHLHEEGKADKLAEFLDVFWTRMEAHDAARGQWIDKELHRQLEVAAGVTDRPADPLPASPVTIREQAKAKLIVDDMIARSLRLRQLTGEIDNYPRATEAMTARLAIKGVMPGPGAAEPFSLELQADHEKLSEDSLNAVREHIGPRAWDELLNRIAVLFSPPAEPPDTASGGSAGGSETGAEGAGPAPDSSDAKPAPSKAAKRPRNSGPSSVH